MSIKITKNIYDHSGKLLFSIPIDTVLDKLPIELWIIMDRYNKDDIFVAIGVHSKEYPGYRLVCRNELFNNYFGEKINSTYQKNHGILSLDNVKSGRISINNNFNLQLNCASKNVGSYMIKKGEYALFYIHCTLQINLHSAIWNYYVSHTNDNIGLFISDDYIFKENCGWP